MKHIPIIIACCLGFIACELLEPGPFVEEPIDPMCEVDLARVDGTWTITGTGERSGCRDSTLNAPFFELRSQGLPIIQAESHLELTGENLPTAFVFSNGMVMGRCVTFRTNENTDLGTIEYVWSGVVSEDGRTIVGQFTGTGPEDCQSRGNFQIPLP